MNAEPLTVVDNGGGTRTLHTAYQVGPNLRVSEDLTYTDGTAQIGVRYGITNISAAPTSIRVGALADLYVGNNDSGTGVIAATPPRFVGGRDDASGLVYGLQEITPWSAFQEGDFELVFDNFAANGLNNTVDSAAPDNGVGASWQIDNLAPGETRAIDVRWLLASPAPPGTVTPPAANQADENGVVHAAPGGVLPPPQPGKTININLRKGKVCYTPPKTKKCIPLTDPVQIPVGSLIDTTKGEINLVSAADKGGGVQNAWFYSGIFKVGQLKDLTTELQLAGPKLSCPKGKKASTSAKKPKTRKLWGNGKGRFRTKGQYSSATVRGTRWVVIDRCDGTLTQVKEGSRARARRQAAQERDRQGRKAVPRTQEVSWVSIFAGFLVAHMVGDYLFQTDWQARNKRGGLSGGGVSRRALLTHVTTYTLAFLPAFVWIGSELDAGVGDRRRRARLPPAPDHRRRPPRRALPRTRQGRRRAERVAGRLGRPVLPRALAVPRGAGGGFGMKRRRGPLTLFAVALIAVAVGLAFDAAHFMKGAERATVDKRFSIRGAQDAPADIVVVTMDERAVADGDGKVPFDRSRDAKVIDALTKAGAKVIAYDVPFTDASDDEEADNALFDAVSNVAAHRARRRRGRSGRPDHDLRRRRGLAAERCHAGGAAPLARRRRRDPAHGLLGQRPGHVRARHRAARARPAHAGAARRTCLDRLPRGVHDRQLRRRRERPVLRRRRPRQDRGRRADRRGVRRLPAHRRPTSGCPSRRSTPPRSTRSCAASRCTTRPGGSTRC